MHNAFETNEFNIVIDLVNYSCLHQPKLSLDFFLSPGKVTIPGDNVIVIEPLTGKQQGVSHILPMTHHHGNPSGAPPKLPPLRNKALIKGLLTIGFP